MSWLAIVIVIVGIYLVLKVVGVLFKVALLLAVFAAGWYLILPILGMARPF